VLRRISGIKNHYAEKRDHIGEPVERRIEITAEKRDVTRFSGDVAVEHIKKIGDDQNDSRPEKFTGAEQNAAADIYRDTDSSQNVRMNAAVGKPFHHPVNNPLRSASDARSKHLSRYLPAV
jgi:hypothetical protein